MGGPINLFCAKKNISKHLFNCEIHQNNFVNTFDAKCILNTDFSYILWLKNNLKYEISFIEIFKLVEKLKKLTFKYTPSDQYKEFKDEKFFVGYQYQSTSPLPMRKFAI